MPLSKLLENLQCPDCSSGDLEIGKEAIICNWCSIKHPVFKGIPILISGKKSLFSAENIFNHPPGSVSDRATLISTLKSLSKFLPALGKNNISKKNYKTFGEAVTGSTARPNILIIGCGEMGEGIESLYSFSSFNIVPSDIYLSGNCEIVLDALDIPFKDGTFDGIVLQAVLEHVIDPYKCVDEAFRVLKKDGIIYAETPFMQQVHAKEYDFTRFTDLGHRRLFRRFEEIKRGCIGGPGSVLGWSYRYFLVSFTKIMIFRYALDVFARITGFWFKYFDYFIANSPGGYDGGWGYFFLGNKSTKIIEDKEIIASFRGWKG